LFSLDERFGQVVASTGEPMIGLMRLAWWREALEKLDRDPAPAEPLLRLLADHVVPCGVTGAQLAAIEDGWAALIDGDADADSIARHGRERGRNLFVSAASILRADTTRLGGAGEIWALVDLGYRHSDARVRATALAQANQMIAGLSRERWPKAARPLAALLTLAIRDARTDKRMQGSPGRLLRMLALRLTGR
jgi:phytoene synthase